jgi:hypothetical protein
MSTIDFIYQTQAMNVLKKYLMDKNKKKFSNAHEWLLQVLERTDSPIKSYIFYYLSDVLFSQRVCVLKLSKVNIIKIK